MGYPVWGFRIEKKSPDFRSPEVGISETSWQKVKNMNHFVFLCFYFGAKNGSPALGMANSLV